jgi:hypothetical protein
MPSLIKISSRGMRQGKKESFPPQKMRHIYEILLASKSGKMLISAELNERYVGFTISFYFYV